MRGEQVAEWFSIWRLDADHARKEFSNVRRLENGKVHSLQVEG